MRVAYPLSIISEKVRALKRNRDERKLSILLPEQVLLFAMDIAGRILVLESGNSVHEALLTSNK